MVGRVSVILIASLMASPCLAQVADWRSSGGDLFWASPGDLQVPAVPAPTVEERPARRIPAPDQPYQAEIERAARAFGLDPKLLHALVIIESAYRPDAVSPVGAAGLAQLMPGTARDLGVRDRFDPVENLIGGADYLSRQILRFGDIRLALAAYNAGPGRVARLGRVPSIPETQHYVRSVIDCYLALTAGRTVLNSRQCQSPDGPDRSPWP